MKATSHAWCCVGFLPISHFDESNDVQSMLKARVWHRCADRIFANLKTAARTGKDIADPFGNKRRGHTLLVGWIADLPEQQLISGTAKSVSPVSTARTKQFGDPFPHPQRLGKDTIDQLSKISVDPWDDLHKYQAACKRIGLLGVPSPFWRDWYLAEPSEFLLPEILHTGHKFFFDHILKWCKEIVGKKELDFRFKCMQKAVGKRHFGKGVCHVQQMTGREHREIQRTIVLAIHGVAPPPVVRVVHHMIEFLYLAQSPRQTSSSIVLMEFALQDFHREKSAILEAGGRKGKNGTIAHFNIPKLELLQQFTRFIRRAGSLLQYTADVSERLLITHCKHPFGGTGHGEGFEAQIARILKIREKAHVFDLYSLLRMSGDSLINALCQEASVLANSHPESAWISRVLPGEEKRLGVPRPVRNFFEEADSIISGTRAYHVNKAPHIDSISIDHVAQLYGLPDLRFYLSLYAGSNNLNFDTLRVWYTFKLQLCSAHQIPIVMPAYTVQAYPPRIKSDFALCDAVMLEDLIDGRWFSHNPFRPRCHIIYQVHRSFRLVSSSISYHAQELPFYPHFQQPSSMSTLFVSCTRALTPSFPLWIQMSRCLPFDATIVPMHPGEFGGLVQSFLWSTVRNLSKLFRRTGSRPVGT